VNYEGYIVSGAVLPVGRRGFGRTGERLSVIGMDRKGSILVTGYCMVPLRCEAVGQSRA